MLILFPNLGDWYLMMSKPLSNMKKANKYSLILLISFLSIFQLFGQEKKAILLDKNITSSTLRGYKAQYKPNRKMIAYQWRYIDSSNWNSLGKGYASIKPVLYQYKRSKRLFRQSRCIPIVGLVSGGSLFVGGVIATLTNSSTDDNTRVFIGIGAAIVGGFTIVLTQKAGIKMFERSVDEYNKLVREDRASSRTLKLGIAYDGQLNAPILRFQLSI
ncbi:MAG: hypothetical protein AB8B56_06995 [Crocinitomicaceae bacterium]